MTKERYYSESLLRSLAYEDDVNGNCDGTIDFTIIDSISGADVAPVVHGEWKEETEYYADDYSECNTRKVWACSLCGRTEKIKQPYCNCGAKMDGGK